MFIAFLVMKTSGILFFWPKLSQTCTESVVRGEVQVCESLDQKNNIPEVFITKKAKKMNHGSPLFPTIYMLM